LVKKLKLLKIAKAYLRQAEFRLKDAREAFLSPEEVISKEDAEDATGRATKTYELCKRLISEIEDTD